MDMNISDQMMRQLRCPRTQSELRLAGGGLECVVNAQIRYPIVDGVPVLINEENSLFTIADYVRKIDTTYPTKRHPVKKFIRRWMPKIGCNLRAKENYAKVCAELPAGAKVLVIGGSVKGLGLDALYARNDLEIIGSDVAFGPYASLICDAHDIPFVDGTFDCVVAQVVLEHVVDPVRCVAEIHRVLKDGGIVYAETPFMQQVHMWQYDFTRFTHLGHRRLFRYFTEMESGLTGGPGRALAWSWRAFLRSFATTHVMFSVMTFIGEITSFFWKYFDYYLANKPGAYDAASEFFFLGRKSREALPDRVLIEHFRGMK